MDLKCLYDVLFLRDDLVIWFWLFGVVVLGVWGFVLMFFWVEKDGMGLFKFYGDIVN